MNIRLMSCLILVRHAELVSASITPGNQPLERKTLKQVQGDDLVMIDRRHSERKSKITYLYDK